MNSSRKLLMTSTLYHYFTRCANYSLLVPSTVNAGSTLECLLTVLYDSPNDVTVTVSNENNAETINSVQSPSGSGEFAYDKSGLSK